MAQIILNLTGSGGLADNFFGDTDSLIPAPNQRIATMEGEMASGLFNPFFRKGYLSPTITTTTNVTTDQTPASELSSVEYDVDTGEVYFADRGINLFKGDSPIDTSLTRVQQFTNSDGTWDEIHDLEIYEINGVKKMFAVGKGMPLDVGPLVDSGTLASTNYWRTLTISVPPAATTKPSVVYTGYDWYPSWGFTTINRTANSSGTNRRLYVILARTTGAITAPTSVTFNGVAVPSLENSLNVTDTPVIRIYELKDPPVFNGNVVITWADPAPTNLAVWTVVVNDASLVDNSQQLTLNGNTTAPRHQFLFTDRYSLNLAFVASRAEFSPSSEMTEIRTEPEAVNGFYTSLIEDPVDAYGLQVAYGAIPWSLEEGAWLSTVATGGFISRLDSDYAFMRKADNGFAYLFADNAVHKIDGSITGGTTGAATKNVLLLPDYFRIKDAIDYRSRLYMAIHQYAAPTTNTNQSNFTGNCGILIWDRVSTQLGGLDFIEVPGVREIKKLYASPDGMLKMIAISNAGLTEVRRFGYNDSGGVVFPVSKTLGIGAYPQYPDGLTIANNQAVWLGNDGTLYTEEDLPGPRITSLITRLMEIKAPGVTQSTLSSNIKGGALLFASDVETADSGFRTSKQGFTLSYKDGASVVNRRVYPFDTKNNANAVQNVHQGDAYTGVQYIPINSNVRGLRIYNLPITGTGTDVIATIKVYFNQGTSAVWPNGITKSITKDEAKRGYVDLKINSHNVHAVQVEIEWNNTTTLGPDTYHPSVAIITHDDPGSSGPDNE